VHQAETTHFDQATQARQRAEVHLVAGPHRRDPIIANQHRASIDQPQCQI
jgi:hypothetical protein